MVDKVTTTTKRVVQSTPGPEPGVLCVLGQWARHPETEVDELQDVS